MSWSRTFGFATTQVTTAALIQIWCSLVQHRFRYFHPHEWGKGLSSLYWDYAWTYSAFAVVLSVVVVALQCKRRSLAYEVVVRTGYLLLILWVGWAVIAMEVPFTPWVDLRGEHY